MMLSWYAVYTQPGKEVLAARQLRNQGFDVYLPQYQKLRRHAGRADIIATALFPRYVFVGVDMERQRWRSVNGTRGVVGLVMFGDKPIPVPNVVIEEIRSREDDAGYVRLNGPTYERGQTLRIVEGPMVDTRAIFEEQVDGNRAILLVSLLGRLVRTRMPLRQVEAA